MSEVTIESLQNEIEQHKLNAKGLIAQIEATKGMLNENLDANLKFRASLVMYAQANKEFIEENAKLKKDIETHKAQIVGLASELLSFKNDKVIDLSKPQNGVEVTLDHCVPETIEAA